MNNTSGFALSVTYAECVWIARELLTPCCGTSPGCLGLEASQTKACPNKINVFVLFSSEWILSHCSRAQRTERRNERHLAHMKLMLESKYVVYVKSHVQAIKETHSDASHQFSGSTYKTLCH